jgi:protein-S-isoprenylcysteine O-methyltransferase Ste14
LSVCPGEDISRFLTTRPGSSNFSRNPIYLGMIGSLAGITLTLPTWFSIGMAAGVVWCIRTQTIEEEAYLERTYGEAFRQYAADVGRFVPGLGRLC